MTKIVTLSDTHTKHKRFEIPKCDILIHAGDFTWTGKYWEVRRFLDWLEQQPATYKVIIAGNHELTLDGTHDKFNESTWKTVRSYRDKNIFYLENSAVEINGIKFYGTPWTPWFCNWAFNGLEGADAPFKRGLPLDGIYGDIPRDVNILICHGPPYGIVDRSTSDDRCGSTEMRKLLESDKFYQLRLYLCGHIHEARGYEVACGNVHICNVSSLGRDYETAYPPVIIDLDEDGFVQSVKGYE